MKKSFICRNMTKVAVMLVAVLMAAFLHLPVPVHASDDIDLDYLKSVIEMVMDKYRGDITERQLLEGAIKGVFDTMDAYTTYYTLDEAQDFLLNIEGNYEGIGVVLEKVDEGVLITKVFDSTPAQEAGLVRGDIIVAVNDESIRGKSLEEVASLIKGKIGTSVTLSIMRAQSDTIISVEVRRAIVEINPVVYEIREGDLAYIQIEMFNGNAEKFVKKALKDADERGITKVILDMRDNPGGEVSQAVNIAKYFVPEGIITTLDFKSENTDDKVYYSDLKEIKYDLVVLVNEGTASASEILAGAVQDTDAGILVGTNTFGKALVQNLIPIITPEAFEKYRREIGEDVVEAYELMTKYGIIPMDREIMGWTKITTGVYITPSGRVLDENGLEPDYYVNKIEPINNVMIDTITRLGCRESFRLNSQGADVYGAEMILKALGYNVDTPNTILDNMTYRAIRSFQNDMGLYPDGLLNPSTQEKLNEKLDDLLRENDCQYMKALELL